MSAGSLIFAISKQIKDMTTNTQLSAAYLLQEGDIFKMFRSSPIAYKVTKVIQSNGMVFIDAIKAVHGLNSIHVTDVKIDNLDFWAHDHVYLLTETA